MKRYIISIVCILTAAVICNVSAFAAVSTAISDGGFEDGIGNAYANDGQTVLGASTDKAHSGNQSLKNSGRSNEWGAAAFNVTDYIKGCGDGIFHTT